MGVQVFPVCGPEPMSVLCTGASGHLITSDPASPEHCIRDRETETGERETLEGARRGHRLFISESWKRQPIAFARFCSFEPKAQSPPTLREDSRVWAWRRGCWGLWWGSPSTGKGETGQQDLTHLALICGATTEAKGEAGGRG